MNAKDRVDSDREVLRSALRVSARVLAKLETESSTLSDADVLREYILLCPYVEPDAPAMKVALNALEQYKSGEMASATLPALFSVSATTSDDETLSDKDKHEKDESEESVQEASDASSCVESQTEEIEIIEEIDEVVIAPPKKKAGPVSVAARTVFLDIPIFMLFMLSAFCLWVGYVNDNYLSKQLKAANFSRKRKQQEITYYRRSCTAADMTTKNGADLFLDSDATPREAYEHQLLHGFSVFRNVISEEASNDLRNFVISRNRNLTEEESIFVIENKNRFSFGLGTEEPSVVRVLKEIATNDRLRPALEEIMGPNPALIEMTAITSSYGAVPQYWHDDVIPSASAMNYGRTFGPSYSVFVQLQNTTRNMGATAACPGTHYCSTGGIAGFCEQEGFQLVNEEEHWGVGDALLMNMNSYHRGGAHTDPDGLDRVMLILTFVPKPIERAESRLLSQGITFSLRYDMWGHTLEDLATAATSMNFPFAFLRSFGLWNKMSKDTWGVDYISSTTMRMANGDNGFRRDELDDLLERGGIFWLPDFLQGTVEDDEGWYEYLHRTLQLCTDFTLKVSGQAVAVALLASLLTSSASPVANFVSTGFRFATFAGLALVTLKAAQWHVDNTGWAKDIIASRRYASTVPAEILHAIPYNWPTVFPTRNDVLVETRYGSRQFHMYNDFINGHPGNRRFQEVIPSSADVFMDYSFEFQEAAASYIVGQMGMEGSRFLHQAPNGVWQLMDDDAAISFVKRELLKKATPWNNFISTELRFLISDVKYGILRETSMAVLDLTPYLDDWAAKLVKGMKAEPQEQGIIRQVSNPSANVAKVFERTISLPASPQREAVKRWNTRQFPHQVPPKNEPYAGAWFTEGDIAEGIADEDYYYMGTITHISAHGDYSMSYPDGDKNVLDRYEIRPFERYREGEELEALVEDGYIDCEIVAEMEDGSFHAVSGSGRYLTGLTVEDFRRSVKSRPKKHTYKSAY